MRKYVTETAEDLKGKLSRAEEVTNEEGIKLYEKQKIKFEFDHYSGEIRLIFVKQTVFVGGKLTHDMLQPLVKRLKGVDRKWYIGIMLYGGRNGKDEEQVS